MFHGFKKRHDRCCDNCQQARAELDALRDLADAWESAAHNPGRDRSVSVTLHACANQLHERLGMPFIERFRKEVSHG